MDALCEVRWGCDEAEDEVVAGGEVVEVAGMEEDVVMKEEMDGEVFVGRVSGGVCGVAEQGVPAGFGVEELAGRMGMELGLEVGAIFANTGAELRAERVALGEERGESGLRGGAEGEMPLSIKPKDGCRWDLVSLGGDSGCVRRSDAPTDDTRRWRR